MASETDKFVLQYQVEMKDAISRLEQLSASVKKVNKETNNSTNEFKDFSKGASDEVGKLIPGIEKVSSAIGVMGAGFSAAAVAVGALAVGVKAVIDLRAQYGEQRLTGMQSGFSSLRMEEYQRKFVRNSGGMVTRDAAKDQIQNLSEKLQAAYADPTRQGTEARVFRLAGVEVGAPGKGQTGFNDAFSQLAKSFSQMRPDQVQGVAKAIGMNQDFALTLQKLGPAVGRVTELTAADIQKRQDSESSLAKFNTELGLLNEKTNNLEISLGQRLIPTFTKLIDLINQIVDAVPDYVKKAEHIGGTDGKGGFNAVEGAQSLYEKISPVGMVSKAIDRMKAGASFGDIAKESAGSIASNVTPLGVIHKGYTSLKDYITGGNKDQVKKNDESSAEQGKKPTAVTVPIDPKSKKTLDEWVTGADRQNEAGTRAASDMARAISMFSGAVSSFSSAIDEKQAWAAWAGEAGRAAGLSGPTNIGGNGLPGVTRGLGATPYEKEFQAASDATGLPVDILKRIGKRESSFRADAKSKARAEGIMQLMPAIQKHYGVTNAKDPQQNIMAGAKLFAENLKMAGGDIRLALRYYQGGPDKSKWGKENAAYPDQVLGTSDLGRGDGDYAAGMGESRNSTNLMRVQRNLASRLNVPVEQLQQGRINRGDVVWGESQLEAGYHNNIFSLNKELTNPLLPAQSRAKIMNDLREQQNGLQLMQQYAPTVEEKAQQGARSLTVGENAIVININGINDPAKLGEILDNHLQNHLGDIVNHASDAIKY